MSNFFPIVAAAVVLGWSLACLTYEVKRRHLRRAQDRWMAETLADSAQRRAEFEAAYMRGAS